MMMLGKLGLKKQLKIKSLQYTIITNVKMEDTMENATMAIIWLWMWLLQNEVT